MDKVIKYINDNFPSGSPQFQNLNKILTHMVSDSSTQLYKLCATNICIDYKYSLVPDAFYEQLALIKSDMDDFINGLQTHKIFHLLCTTKCPRYATIIPSNIFNSRLRYGFASTKKLRFDAPSKFAAETIKTKGWLWYKPFDPIAWVTPLDSLIKAIEMCNKGDNISNYVFNYIGVLTNKNFEDYVKSFNSDETRAYIICYSEEVMIEFYHPNCTMPYGWHSERYNNMYVSFFRNTKDQFGRTYNELGAGPAKERIHKNSYHFDNRYELIELEHNVKFSSETTKDRKKVLKKARKRL